jgi:hypothetical protein
LSKLSQPETSPDPLTEVSHCGAPTLSQQAAEAAVVALFSHHPDELDDNSRRGR